MKEGWIPSKKSTDASLIFSPTQGRIYLTHVHAANKSDSKQGVHLLKKELDECERLEKIMADQGYLGTFGDQVKKAGYKFETPKRKEGQQGFVVEAKRWVVERSLAWLNFYRRVVKDYERTVESSCLFLLLANVSMILPNIVFDRE